MDEGNRMNAGRTLAGMGFAVSMALAIAPAAHADANSYLAYLREHQINTGFQTDAWLVKSGLNACELLHQGMTIDQVSEGLSFIDARGIALAAQHELCPDTLH